MFSRTSCDMYFKFHDNTSYVEHLRWQRVFDIISKTFLIKTLTINQRILPAGAVPSPRMVPLLPIYLLTIVGVPVHCSSSKSSGMYASVCCLFHNLKFLCSGGYFLMSQETLQQSCPSVLLFQLLWLPHTHWWEVCQCCQVLVRPPCQALLRYIELDLMQVII